MIQMFLNFSYFSTNLDFVYLCLPLLTFVYLCSTDASMHKFCACWIKLSDNMCIVKCIFSDQILFLVHTSFNKALFGGLKSYLVQTKLFFKPIFYNLIWNWNYLKAIGPFLTKPNQIWSLTVAHPCFWQFSTLLLSVSVPDMIFKLILVTFLLAMVCGRLFIIETKDNKNKNNINTLRKDNVSKEHNRNNATSKMNNNKMKKSKNNKKGKSKTKKESGKDYENYVNYEDTMIGKVVKGKLTIHGLS